MRQLRNGETAVDNPVAVLCQVGFGAAELDATSLIPAVPNVRRDLSIRLGCRAARRCHHMS